MSLLTCFLPNFPRQLSGRAKASEASQTARGLRQLSGLALPDLAALLGSLLPEHFFAEAADTSAKRDRLYPPVTVFWAFLFQVLNPAMACLEVVGKLRAWLICSVPLLDWTGDKLTELVQDQRHSHPVSFLCVGAAKVLSSLTRQGRSAAVAAQAHGVS